MEYAVLGDAEEGPQLRLDHREFSYAGKFVMSNTGKAVAREKKDEREAAVSDEDEATDEDGESESELVAAIAFNEDRTDPATAWLRYVTVRRERRGEGVGARLARFAAAELRERGYDRVKIAVNNPFAYHALYKAGFAYADEQTGLAELVLAYPDEALADPDERDSDGRGREARPRDAGRYQSGLDAYRERDDLAPEEREFLDAKADADPPDVVPVPE